MKIILPEEDFIYYAKKHEEYYKNNRYSFHIGEIVILPNDEHKEQIGIVKSFSSINNSVYVLSYDDKAKKCWICNFKEIELKRTDILLENVSDELYNKYCYYVDNFQKIKFI